MINNELEKFEKENMSYTEYPSEMIWIGSKRSN